MDFFDVLSLVVLGVFLAGFLGRTVALETHGVHVFVIGAGKKGIRAAREYAAVVILLVYLAAVPWQALHAPRFLPVLFTPLVPWTPSRIAGAGFLVLGVSAFIAALVSFGRSWRIGIDTQSPGGLATQGVFKVSRNPIFTSMDLLLIGTFLVYPTWLFLALAVVFAVGVHFHILEEERFLSSRYGKEYTQYAARVPRYFLAGRAISTTRGERS